VLNIRIIFEFLPAAVDYYTSVSPAIAVNYNRVSPAVIALGCMSVGCMSVIIYNIAYLPKKNCD